MIPVSMLVISMSAPGITAPVASATTPVTLARLAWPATRSRVAIVAMSMTASATHRIPLIAILQVGVVGHGPSLIKLRPDPVSNTPDAL